MVVMPRWGNTMTNSVSDSWSSPNTCTPKGATNRAGVVWRDHDRGGGATRALRRQRSGEHTVGDPDSRWAGNIDSVGKGREHRGVHPGREGVVAAEIREGPRVENVQAPGRVSSTMGVNASTAARTGSKVSASRAGSGANTSSAGQAA